LDAGSCQAAYGDGGYFGVIGGRNGEEGAESEAINELSLLIGCLDKKRERGLAFPTKSVTGCAAKICMKTGPILTMHPIPNVTLFPSLSARYPEPIAPKKPPIGEEVLKAICQL
jgi:hypothetical protein